MNTCGSGGWESDKPIFPVRPISNVMLDVEKSIRQVALSNVHVLVVGETGTGKEGAAKAIHRLSARASKPFVAVNCSEFSDALCESDLFGHAKGAYTGAISNRRGQFEEANGGTLFLDEIADMDLKVQAKMLRAIQEMEIRRLGETRSVSLDLRFIAATNKDLDEEIKQGRFREDLYQRLAGFWITLPPLRYRKEDLPGLIGYFLDNPHILRVPKRCTISAEAREILLRRAWENGNVRELMNMLSAAVIRCPDDNVIRPEHLSLPSFDQPWIKGGDEGAGAEMVHEKDRLLLLLEKHNWNHRNVAEELGCSVRTVFRKLKAHGLKRPEL